MISYASITSTHHKPIHAPSNLRAPKNTVLDSGCLERTCTLPVLYQKKIALSIQNPTVLKNASPMSVLVRELRHTACGYYPCYGTRSVPTTLQKCVPNSENVSFAAHTSIGRISIDFSSSECLRSPINTGSAACSVHLSMSSCDAP